MNRIVCWPCLGLLGAVSAAVFADGANLLSKCKAYVEVGPDRSARDPVEAFRTDICVGGISGLVHVGRLLPRHISFCNPPGVTPGQAPRMVVAYIEAHPERIHDDFTELALEAMYDTWPCP
jgi:hypothetical protein